MSCFFDSDNVGKQATFTVSNFLTSHPNHISLTSVETDPKYQEQDIDLIWENKLGTFTIEVKGDSYHHTGNVFLETTSNQERNTPGCFLYTQAQFLIYCFITPGSGLIIPVLSARKWFEENINQFRLKRTFTNVCGGGYHTLGRLVPISTLLSDVPGVRTFNSH